MKRLIVFLIAVFFVGALFGQNKFTYPIEVGKVSVSNGQITLIGSTSGSVVIKPNVVAGTGTIFQLPASNGTNGYVLSTNGSGVLSWIANGAGSMVYPGTGIPLSTGSAWGTSITNNSVNWDSAYAARLRWSGTVTGLTAATGRTSLGGTTVGQAFFTLSNPSAITFPRINANNTVNALSASDFRTAIGAGTSSYTNLTSFVDQTAWRVFYSNTSGDVTELALGADGTFLKSNGATSAPTFATPAGSGDVSKVGTPVDNQVGVWTGDGTLEGTTGLTYSGANLQLTGDIGATGTRITKGWFTDMTVTNAITGAVTGNAGTVTGYTPASGSLTLVGADALTLTTTAETNVTLPTTGTLATTAQLDLKANIASPTFTGTVGGITYTMVGAAASSHNQAQSTITVLADSLLARYTKTQSDTKLNLKANLASPTFTGTVVIPSPFTLGATSVTANGTELNVLDNIPGTLTSTELGYVDGVTSAIQTQLDSKVKLLPDSVAYTSNSTLALTDANKLIVATKATSISLTIPANADVAIPIGTTINFIQAGAGIIVFKEASGVTIYSKKDSTATGGVYSWAALYKRATNKWLLYGDILD